MAQRSSIVLGQPIASASDGASGCNRNFPVGTVVSGRTGKLKQSRGGNRTGAPQVLKPAANDLGWPKKTLDELKNDMVAHSTVQNRQSMCQK
jgi:hypothetical protein